jgi:hypothetical protein
VRVFAQLEQPDSFDEPAVPNGSQYFLAKQKQAMEMPGYGKHGKP